MQRKSSCQLFGIVCSGLLVTASLALAADGQRLGPKAVVVGRGVWAGGVVEQTDNNSSQNQEPAPSSDVVYVSYNCEETMHGWAIMCCTIKSDKDACEKSTGKRCVATSRSKLQREFETVKKSSKAAPACGGSF